MVDEDRYDPSKDIMAFSIDTLLEQYLLFEILIALLYCIKEMTVAGTAA